MPLRVDGAITEPPVSVPIEKPTRPAAVAAPGPADEPAASSFVFHGLRVIPPNHCAPTARVPVDNFAIKTAPAARSFVYTVASVSMTRSFHGEAPQVVLVPRTANR